MVLKQTDLVPLKLMFHENVFIVLKLKKRKEKDSGHYQCGWTGWFSAAFYLNAILSGWLVVICHTFCTIWVVFMKDVLYSMKLALPVFKSYD